MKYFENAPVNPDLLKKAKMKAVEDANPAKPVIWPYFRYWNPFSTNTNVNGPIGTIFGTSAGFRDRIKRRDSIRRLKKYQRVYKKIITPRFVRNAVRRARKLAKKVGNGARRVGRAFGRGARAVGRVGKRIGRTMKNAGKRIGRGLQKVGRRIGRGLKNGFGGAKKFVTERVRGVKKNVGRLANFFGQGSKRSFDVVSTGAKKAAKKVKEAVNRTVNNAVNTVKNVGEKTKGVVNVVGQGVGRVFRRL